jgi:hypothetical protein
MIYLIGSVAKLQVETCFTGQFLVNISAYNLGALADQCSQCAPCDQRFDKGKMNVQKVVM